MPMANRARSGDRGSVCRRAKRAPARRRRAQEKLARRVESTHGARQPDLARKGEFREEGRASLPRLGMAAHRRERAKGAVGSRIRRRITILYHGLLDHISSDGDWSS